MSHANRPVDPAMLAEPGSQAQLSTGPNRAMVEGAHHDHHGPPYLAHQFDDLDQQRDASTLGMWAFLATEVMFFGGLFAAFTVYRMTYPEQFAEASHHMNRFIGTINTGVLLISSFTVALAVAAAEAGKSRRAGQFLIATIVLALIFLGFKAYEYYHEYVHHLVPFPGFDFHYNDPNPAEGEHVRTPAYAPAVRIYLTIYFIMTGIHATHMVIGIGVFSVVAFQAWRNRYNAEYYNPIEVSGLYWHFVDIVWIFLFPLLYLLH